MFRKMLWVLLASMLASALMVAGCSREDNPASSQDDTEISQDEPGDRELGPYEIYPSGWKLPFCGRYQISCGYGCGYHVDGSSCYSKNRYALDWNLPGTQDEGESIPAPASGTVKYSGYHSQYGNQVIIDAGGGYLYRIAHMQRDYVSAGQVVQQGDLIGLVGNTGAYSTGPHIHFSVHYPASYVSPGKICGNSVSQNGISGNWTYQGGKWYDSNQDCQCIP